MSSTWDNLKKVGSAALPWVTGQKQLNYATDALGITHSAPPDLSKGPDADALRQLRDKYSGAFDQAVAYPGQAPQVAPMDRRYSDAALAYLDTAARGAAPSAAEQLMRSGIDEAQRSALGRAATLQGSNPGMALRAGLSAGTDAVTKSAADAAALRATEMAGARDRLATAASDYYGQDLKRQQGNQDATNTYKALQDHYTLGLGNLSAQTAVAPLSAAQAAQALQIQNSAANSAGVGGLIKTGGTLLAASDERVKENITASPEAADDFLRSLHPKTFDYKDPSAPGEYPGHQLGVIAQDLAGGVTTGPDGKKWLSADVIGRVLAGLGRLNEKVDDMGGRR